MKGWNEDNFLDEMAPLLARKDARQDCRDQETLCAAVDGVAGKAVQEAVASHLSKCSACAQLERRLREFAGPSAPAPEGEWRDAEKRLDHWMEDLVGSRAPAVTPDVHPKPVRRWNLYWLLAPAGALAVAAGILLMRLPSAPPTAIPAGNLSAGTAQPAQIIAPVPPSDAGLQLTAGQGQQPALPEAVEAGGNIPAGSAPAASTGPGDARPVDRAAALVSDSGAIAPVSVRLQAGTRVWIVLKSSQPLAGGDFEFRGVVLLPVTEGDAVVLERDAEVHGIGKRSQGRTSVKITDFVGRGVRYRLRGGAVSLSSGGSIAGAGIEFNAGAVLETWLPSVATYERVPGEFSPPQG